MPAGLRSTPSPVRTVASRERGASTTAPTVRRLPHTIAIKGSAEGSLASLAFRRTCPSSLGGCKVLPYDRLRQRTAAASMCRAVSPAVSLRGFRPFRLTVGSSDAARRSLWRQQAPCHPTHAGAGWEANRWLGPPGLCRAPRVPSYVAVALRRRGEFGPPIHTGIGSMSNVAIRRTWGSAFLGPWGDIIESSNLFALMGDNHAS